MSVTVTKSQYWKYLLVQSFSSSLASDAEDDDEEDEDDDDLDRV